MLAGILTLGVISKTPHISLKIDELQDESQSLVQARIQISQIQSETSSLYYYNYTNADDGAITFSFHLSSIDGIMPPDQGITITIGTEVSNVTTTTTRQTNVTFMGFNAGIYDVAIQDHALNHTYNATLVIGYGENPSYIRYKNADYVGVGSVYFIPVLYRQQNNCKANLTLTNIRNGFATITCTPLSNV